MFRGDDCEIMVECSDFKQFNVIEFEGDFSLTDADAITDVSGQTRGMIGDSDRKSIKKIKVDKTTERNLRITAG